MSVSCSVNSGVRAGIYVMPVSCTVNCGMRPGTYVMSVSCSVNSGVRPGTYIMSVSCSLNSGVRAVAHVMLLLLLSTPLHQRAASRVQHPNHVAANSLSPQVARKGSTLSGFVQRSRLEREVGRDLHSNKWEEV